MELYEYQYKSPVHGWHPDPKFPWTLKTGELCNCPDDFKLPGGEWCWGSNWRIDKKPGLTDEDGWEYA